MTTSLCVPKELWKRAKMAAIRKDISVQQFVWDALSLLLKKLEKQQ